MLSQRRPNQRTEHTLLFYCHVSNHQYHHPTHLEFTTTNATDAAAAAAAAILIFFLFTLLIVFLFYFYFLWQKLYQLHINK